MKNKIVSQIKIKKDLNEYKGIKDIRYLFSIKGIIDKSKLKKILMNTKVLKISGICLMIIYTKVL